MKNLMIVALAILTFTSCQEEGELTRSRSETAISPTAMLRFTGIFSPTSGINVSGHVKIYLENTQHRLRLEDFNISDGPDLKVYVSKTQTPTSIVNLGNLDADRIYDIPQSVNLSDYPYVLIHCQQYDHLFAVAPLTSN